MVAWRENEGVASKTLGWTLLEPREQVMRHLFCVLERANEEEEAKKMKNGDAQID